MDVLLQSRKPPSNAYLSIMTTQVDPVHRWRSLFCLAIAAGMLHWGDAVLRPVLRGWLAVAYWGTCVGFAAFTLIFGIRDIRAVRQSVRLERVRGIRRAHREFTRLRGARLQPLAQPVASSKEGDSGGGRQGGGGEEPR